MDSFIENKGVENSNQVKGPFNTKIERIGLLRTDNKVLVIILYKLLKPLAKMLSMPNLRDFKP